MTESTEDEHLDDVFVTESTEDEHLDDELVTESTEDEHLQTLHRVVLPGSCHGRRCNEANSIPLQKSVTYRQKLRTYRQSGSVRHCGTEEVSPVPVEWHIHNHQRPQAAAWFVWRREDITGCIKIQDYPQAKHSTN